MPRLLGSSIEERDKHNTARRILHAQRLEATKEYIYDLKKSKENRDRFRYKDLKQIDITLDDDVEFKQVKTDILKGYQLELQYANGWNTEQKINAIETATQLFNENKQDKELRQFLAKMEIPKQKED